MAECLATDIPIFTAAVVDTAQESPATDAPVADDSQGPPDATSDKTKKKKKKKKKKKPKKPVPPLYPPPLIQDHARMMEVASELADTIIFAVDMEMVDHVRVEAKDRLSEVGYAILDPRDGGIESIRVRHYIASEWANITPETCPAGFHRDTCLSGSRQQPGPHTASPYTAAFCRSIIVTRDGMCRRVADALTDIRRMNRSDDEIANGILREVVVLYWDAHLEYKLFQEHGISLDASPGCRHWDLQLLQPFQDRWSQQRTAAHKVWTSLGIRAETDGVALAHNSSNDACFVVTTAVCIANLGADEYERWVEGEDLPPRELPRSDPEALSANTRLGRTMVYGQRAPVGPQCAKAQAIAADEEPATLHGGKENIPPCPED